MAMTTQPFDFDDNPDFVAQYDRGPPMFMPHLLLAIANAPVLLK